MRKATARDPKKHRVFVTISRQPLLDSAFSTVICAPIYSAYDGLSTQVPVGVEDGLKHDCSIHCDELLSLPKAALTDFVARLTPDKLGQLDRALAIAVGIA